MPDEQRGKSNYHTHALARGLLVLETVAGRRDPATLTEIHETSGLPKSTIVRLLSALVEEDYLVRVGRTPVLPSRATRSWRWPTRSWRR